MSASPECAELLRDRGYAVVPEAIGAAELEMLVAGYDRVMMTDPGGLSSDGSNRRVHDLVGKDSRFERLLAWPLVLAAADAVIAGPFKLSVLLARSVLPGAAAQALHADFERDAHGWPMLGFILMVDAFTAGNGATRFVPGSHRQDDGSDPVDSEPACGPAGSLILYNGSVRHCFGANRTALPRRSIQGAYIRRSATGWHDQVAR